MENQYSLWKSSEFPMKMKAEEVNWKIGQVIVGLNVHYGLYGISENEVLAIQGFIQTYLTKYPRFKLIDIDRSIELFKKRPELNKICPEYFETIFEKYRKSDERKVILKTWEEDLEAHSNELTEAKKEYDPNELLQICYNTYKESGIINLNSGIVYEKNFVLLKQKLGVDRMAAIRDETQRRLISEFEETLYKLPKTSSLRDEAQSQLNLIKQGSGLVKRETRKQHLKVYFDEMDKTNK